MDTCYTATGKIQVPDVVILKLEPGWKTEPLRGYAFTAAVLNVRNECIGWMHVKNDKFPI